MSVRALVAEFVGTFVIVVVIAGIGLAGGQGSVAAVALGAGAALTVAGLGIGHASGGHFNPAVTIGLIAAGRFDSEKAPAYIIAQVLGGVFAALVLGTILAGEPVAQSSTFAAISNGYGGPGRAGLMPAFLLEGLFTAILLAVIVGATARRAPAGMAPLAAGLAFAAGYLVLGPVSGGSLNPARSTATAVLGGLHALSQLWVFWVAPLLGAVIGGIVGRYLQEE